MQWNFPDIGNFFFPLFCSFLLPSLIFFSWTSILMWPICLDPPLFANYILVSYSPPLFARRALQSYLPAHQFFLCGCYHLSSCVIYFTIMFLATAFPCSLLPWKIVFRFVHILCYLFCCIYISLTVLVCLIFFSIYMNGGLGFFGLFLFGEALDVLLKGLLSLANKFTAPRICAILYDTTSPGKVQGQIIVFDRPRELKMPEYHSYSLMFVIFPTRDQPNPKP